MASVAGSDWRKNQRYICQVSRIDTPTGGSAEVSHKCRLDRLPSAAMSKAVSLIAPPRMGTFPP